MVKLIFEKYASGEYSTPMLEKLLYEKGYRNYSGRKINRGVIGHIITNPKYKGFYVGGKVKIVDMFTKKQKFIDPQDWVIWQDEDGTTVPAIVDEATWEKANHYFSERSTQIKSRKSSFKHNNLFTGKIFCANDNAPYYLKARKNRKGEPDCTWICSHKTKNGAASCSSFPLKQDELLEMLSMSLLEIYDNFDFIIDKYMEYYKAAQIDEKDTASEIKRLELEIEKFERRKDKLLDLNLDGKISNEEFGKRNDKLNEDIEKLEKAKAALLEKSKSDGNPLDDFVFIKNTIKSYLKDGKLQFTQASINDMIDKILVKPTDKYTAEVSIILRTQTVKKYVAYSRKNAETEVVRSVNTFNTIMYVHTVITVMLLHMKCG